MTEKPSAAMSNAGFVHLHVHSAYSLLKGSIKIQKLGELAKADRQPALALTDTDNMFGALEFSDKMAGYGIQPIIGCELAVDFGDQDPNARSAHLAGPARIVLLASRERGYRSLMRLNSRAFLETPIHQSPHIKFEWLQGDAEDLIALTGGPEGPISLALHADHAALAATRCDWLAPMFGDRRYIELQRQAEEGLSYRLRVHGHAPGESEGNYRARLAFELDVITRMNYAGYFLIVADFIKWAKAEGIPVGPGRGSGAGSLVAYALTITDLDPIRFGLLFERFLNPERVSMPDFDIDFCQDRRGEVIDYVQHRYGREQVAQIITFGTLQARGVLRDVGRVLEMPYGQVDKLCKLVPQNPAAPVTLAKAIDGEPRLQAERDGNPIVKRAFDIAQKLEGLHRHASTHAAGIVIGERPLTEMVPLYRDPKSNMPVTHFNMKWVEQAGLGKFHVLGLKALTVAETAVARLRKRGVELDRASTPLEDATT